MSLVGIGTLHPLSRKRVCPPPPPEPPEPKRGAGEEAEESTFRRREKKLSTLSTLGMYSTVVYAQNSEIHGPQISILRIIFSST